MARLTSILAILVLVVACAPAVAPTLERDGEQVTVRATANQALYDATLHVTPATTEDERCIALGEEDIACRLGDVPEGDTITVEATSPGGASCILYAYLEPDRLTSYRPYLCAVR